MSRFGIAVGFMMVLSGCAKTMAESDCQKVADHLTDVWNAEAKKKAPADAKDTKAAAVIQAEGERTVNEFLGECKKDLAGQRVDPDEVSCLLAADTVDAVTACSLKP